MLSALHPASTVDVGEELSGDVKFTWGWIDVQGRSVLQKVFEGLSRQKECVGLVEGDYWTTLESRLGHALYQEAVSERWS